MFRHLPPANSPLSFSALLTGLRAALTADEGALAEVGAAVRDTHHPQGLLLTDSGTTALTLALKAIAAEAGEVAPVIALPGYCCYDVATAADGAGVRVALYDLDPDTLSPDLPSLERTFSVGARAVVVVHLYGIPVDLTSVRAAARVHGAVVIEDAAQGIGTVVDGRPAGSSGSLGVLSFGRGKGITGGGGGALLANDEVGTRLLRAVEGELVPSGMWLRSLAATAAQWVFARPSLYGIVRAMPFLKLGETIYHDVESTGAMAPVNAGILGRTRHSALAETAARRRTADTLLNVLLAGTAFKPITERYGTAGYLRLSALADSAALDSVGSAEAGRLGVMPGYPKTLATLPGFEAKCVIAQSLAGSRILAERLVTFPTHGLLSQGDIERLCAWIKRVECAGVGQPAERAEIPVGRH